MHEIAVHLTPDTLFHIGNFGVTNTLFTSVIVVILIVIGAFFLSRNLSLMPSKRQAALEAIIEPSFKYVKDTLESEALARRYYPFLLAMFVFILLANLIGLLPFVGSVGLISEYHGETKLVSLLYPVNTDLNVPLMLAIVAVLAIEFAGIAALGFLKYAGKFVTFSSVIGFFVGIIELFSEVARLITFSFRLFGNIFAGKVMILVIGSFVPLLLPVPFVLFEVMVGVIQAGIFSLLTLFFIKIAVAEAAH